jgi:hypothetical protein
MYLWLRATYVPFVIDEISTFFLYIQTGEFTPGIAKWDANNHYLNSILVYLSYSVFGLSELSLRLPNLLFSPLLFYATYKISGEFRNRYLAWVFILAISLNHFFIEYSALARGYGMSMSLFLLSLWFTIQLVKHNSIKYYILSLLSITFYLSANLTLIYSAIFTVFVISTITLTQNNKKLKALFARISIILVFGIAPIIGAVIYLFKLKAMNLLYYGISGGFWHVTIESLSFNSVGTNSNLTPFAVTLLFFVTVIIGGIKLSKTKTVKGLSDPGFVFLLLLLFNILMFVSLHYLMDIKYPEDRVGLFFIPLFIGSLLFMVDYAIHLTMEKYLILIAVPLLYLPVHFISNINLSYTLYWKTTSLPKRFFDKVNGQNAHSGFPANIGMGNIDAILWDMLNYRASNKGNFANLIDPSSVSDDFLFANYKDNPKWQSLYDSLDYDPLSEKHLLKRKHPAPKTLFGYTQRISNDSLTTEPYFNFFEGYINKITGKEILVELNLTLKTQESPFYGIIVIDVIDNKHKSSYYIANPLNRIKVLWDGTDSNINLSFITKPIPENSLKLKVYLWNIKGQSYYIQDGELSAFYFE